MAEPLRGEPGTPDWLVFWDERGNIDLDKTRATLPHDDNSGARLMADLVFRDQLHYVPGDKTWYVCSDDLSYHPPDSSSMIGRRVEQFASLLDGALEKCKQSAYAMVKNANTGVREPVLVKMQEAEWDRWKPQRTFAAGLRKAKGLRDLMVYMTSVTCGTNPEVMADHHPRLLNMANCTAVLDPDGPWSLPHDPSRMHTYRVEASLLTGPAAGDWDRAWNLCPGYNHMLWRAAGQDREVFTYLVRVLGYAMLGANPLHLVFFLSGPPRSGKTKLLEVVSTVLGPALSYEAKPALLSSEDPHSRHEASMRGTRLITISETNERLGVNESQLKRLTGTSWVSVSQLYARTMTRVPVTWLFIIDNNQMPRIDYLDPGLQLRLMVLPMGKTIPPEERDPWMAEKIVEAERDGIATMLAWACREAMADGGRALMMPPRTIVEATEQYRREQDTRGLWLAERTYPANGRTPAQSGSDCYADYMEWCAEKDEAPIGRNTFYGDLAARGGIGRTGDAHHVWFTGFILRNPRMG